MVCALPQSSGGGSNGAGVGPVRTFVQRFAVAWAATPSRRRITPRAGALAGLTALCCALAPAHAADVDWNGYVTASSDYIYRGVSLLDSGANLQGSLEARLDDAVVVGTSVTNIDREWQYQSYVSSHLELNVYAGVDVGCGAQCRARVLVTRYNYPGSDAAGWDEATASIAFAQRVGVSVSWSPRGLGTGNSTRTYEGWFVQPLSRNTSLEFDGGTLYIGPYNYWFARAGVSQRFDRWVFDLSHYWSDPSYRRAGLDDRSERFVFSISTAF